MVTGFDNPQDRRPLSPRQHAVLRALVLWIARHRAQPSIRELATAVGLATVQPHLAELEARGWIRRGNGARAIEIPDDVWTEITGQEITGQEITGAAAPQTGAAMAAEQEKT